MYLFPLEAEISIQSGIESCGVVPYYLKSRHDNVPMLCVKALQGEDAIEVVLNAFREVFVKEKILEIDQLPLRVLIVDELPRNGNGKKTLDFVFDSYTRKK